MNYESRKQLTGLVRLDFILHPSSFILGLL